MDLLHSLMAKLEVIRTMKRDERAVTAMEYGLIAAVVATVIIGGFTSASNSSCAASRVFFMESPPSCPILF